MEVIFEVAAYEARTNMYGRHTFRCHDEGTSQVMTSQKHWTDVMSIVNPKSKIQNNLKTKDHQMNEARDITLNIGNERTARPNPWLRNLERMVRF